MTEPGEAWRAMNVRRWHTNNDLSDTTDLTGGHGARVAVLALSFNPDLSREAVIYAVTHDIGEYKAGDLPRPFKQDNPGVRKVVAAYEADTAANLGFDFPKLPDGEAELIKFCDLLDSWLWAKSKAPHIMARQDWREQGWVLAGWSERLGISGQVLAIMGVIE